MSDDSGGFPPIVKWGGGIASALVVAGIAALVRGQVVQTNQLTRLTEGFDNLKAAVERQESAQSSDRMTVRSIELVTTTLATRQTAIETRLSELEKWRLRVAEQSKGPTP